jgi:thymine-DNA glycosylase
MAQNDPTASRPKPGRSSNIDQYLNPKKTSTRRSSEGNSSKTATETVGDGSSTTGQPSPSLRSKRKLDSNAPASDKAVQDTSVAKRHRHSGKYAPPSTYAHLPALPDTITPNLLCLFVGVNPGIQTATMGHPYAHPSNLYWRLLHTSGLTPNRRLAPSEYVILPAQYSLGNTNIVGRATKDASQLSGDEQVAGARVLDEKIRKFRPEAVCLVGKGIWEAVWKWKYGRPLRPREFKYGFQDAQENMGRLGMAGQSGSGGSGGAWPGARVFVATSTSGLAASLSLKQKEEIWQELGDWVNKRREERKRAEAKGSKNPKATAAAATE